MKKSSCARKPDACGPEEERKEMKTSIGIKISSGFALGLAALVVLGTLSYRNITALVASSDNVKRTYQILGKLESVLTAIVDVETGERGFVIKSATAQNVAATRQAGTAAQQLHELGEKLGRLVARYKV
jgi:CHASE3 domain sensor protein